MSSDFPTALPGAKTDFGSSTAVASSHQTAQGEDINAIAAKLGYGATNNAPANNKFLKGTGTGTSQWSIDFKDEDNMASDSATALSSQQSIKAYIDSGTVTMTNKTLTSPVLTSPQINDTSANHQYIFGVSELSADRTVTLPLLTGNDTFIFSAFTQNLSNKTFTDQTEFSEDINLATGKNIQVNDVDPWRTVDLSPGFLKPTTTSGCASVATQELATNDIDYDYLAFDKDSDENAFVNFAMPASYDGGVIQFRFYWTTNTGGGAAETVVMELAGRSFASGDAGDQANGTAVEVSDVWEADKDFMFSAWSGDITLAGTPAGGEMVHLELMRDVSEDNLAEDARITQIQIRFKQAQFSD